MNCKCPSQRNATVIHSIKHIYVSTTEYANVGPSSTIDSISKRIVTTTLRDEISDRSPHVYHVLEGPTLRDDRNPDKQEKVNIHHVLESPALRDGSPDKQGSGNIYHVLEGPTPRDDNSDRNPDKQENVNDILKEGAVPKDEKS